MQFTQLPKTWKQTFLWLFWVGCKINAKIVPGKPFQDRHYILKVMASLSDTFGAGGFSNEGPSLYLREHENGRVHDGDCNQMVIESSMYIIKCKAKGN
jgi:hypothetical protein